MNIGRIMPGVSCPGGSAYDPSPARHRMIPCRSKDETRSNSVRNGASRQEEKITG
jgi:hypothetical protein